MWLVMGREGPRACVMRIWGSTSVRGDICLSGCGVTQMLTLPRPPSTPPPPIAQQLYPAPRERMSLAASMPTPGWKPQHRWGHCVQLAP